MSDIFDPVAATASNHPGLDRWNELLNRVAPQFGVPPNLVKAHMLFESGGDATVVSSDGGYGLLQITSNVVHGLYNGVDILDPFTNVKVACRDFIAPNMGAFPTNLDAVVGAYNAGIGAIERAIVQGRDLTHVTYDPHYIPNVTHAFAWLNARSHAVLKG